MEPVPRRRGLRADVTRLRSALSEPSDLEQAPVGARWDLWRRVTDQAITHTVVADALLALLVAVISTPWLVHHPTDGVPDWALQGALVLPLIWRRRFPVAVFACLSMVALAQWLAAVELLADMALLVSLYTVAAHRRRSVALGAAAVLEGGAVMAAWRWGLTGSWIRTLVFLSGLIAAALLLGTNSRSRRGHLATLIERAERLERERDQQALIVAAAERTRIAREMHDVIAHSLAVMVSLADGATAKLRGDPDRAAAAIRNVSDVGRQALGDTRRLLGVLRAGDPSDGLAPQPGVAQIADLLEQVRATGLAASLVTGGQPRLLAPGTELAAYRIVQEAITNTLKHAVGATELTVSLHYGSELLGITVTDDGRPPVAGAGGGAGAAGGANLLPTGGHGLPGMQERAALYQGTVSAGPTSRGWSVRARLPIAGQDVDPSAGAGRAPAGSSMAPDQSTTPLPVRAGPPR